MVDSGSMLDWLASGHLPALGQLAAATLDEIGDAKRCPVDHSRQRTGLEIHIRIPFILQHPQTGSRRRPRALRREASHRSHS